VPTVAANGLEIAYDVTGAGPPVVMLHGATSLGREDFAAQLPSFRKAFRAYLPDARGHGATRWNAADGFEVGRLVDDLEAFVDALGLTTFHLVGFSMGAMTALHFASRRPDRIRTLVVAGISTAREPRTSVARRLMDPARIDRDDPDFAARLSRRAHAAAGDRRGRRRPAAAHAAAAARDRRPRARRVRRSRPLRAGRPRLGPVAPAA
jgi:pimeloyl-ACP methyl ester carboxylesterase